jgi:hypothetical protein
MLKYYKLPSIKGEGWAHISINANTGFFATVSDWGNYAFLWTAPGLEFREFLMQLQPDYLYGKLMMGRPDHKVFDGAKTKANIIEAIEEHNKETEGGWPYYEEELAVVQAHSFDDEGDFEAWQSETKLADSWEYGERCPAPDCMGFCTKIWPRFVVLLKEELAQEKTENKPSPRHPAPDPHG